MPFPCRWVPGLLLLAAVGAGCKKDAAGVTQPTADAVAPVDPMPAEPAVGPNKKTLDLRTVGIWAKIDVPDNTAVASVRRDECVIRCGPTFAISVKRLEESLDGSKERLTAAGWTFAEQTDAGFVAETETPAPARVVWRQFNPYAAGYAVTVVPAKDLTAEQTARVGESVKTFRPVAVSIEEMTRSQQAAADLRLAGVTIIPRSGGLEVEFPWRAGTEKLLPRLSELVRVSSLNIVGSAPMSAGQLKQAAGNAGLRSLTLAGVPVADAEWAGLDGHATLQELRVGGPTNRPPAGPAVTKAVLARFGKLPALRSLTLRRYAVDAAVLQSANQLGKSRLTAVGFEDAGLTNADVKVLAEHAGWKGLSLADNPVTGDGLRDVKGLEHLDLSGTRVSVRHLAELGDLPLRRLDVSRTDLADAGVKSVTTSFPKLEALNVSATAATEKCLPALAAMTELRELSVAHLAMTAPALGPLAACKKLRSLSLANTTVMPVDVPKLVDELPALEYLDLRATAVEAETADKIAKARPDCHVALAGTPAADGKRPDLQIPDPAPVSVPVALDKLPPADPAAMLKRFDAKVVRDEEKEDKPIIEVAIASAALTDEDLAHLRDVKSLEKLRLDGCEKITEAGLAYLKDAPALTHLTADRTAVTANVGTVVGKFKQLKSLFLPCVTMGAKHLALFDGLADLESFQGVTVPEAQEAFVDCLARHRKLKTFEWGVVEWNNRRLRKLSPLIALEVAELRGPWVSDWGVEVLAGFVNLRELTVRNDLISDAGLKPLDKLAGLNKLHLEGRRLSDGALMAFRNHEQLESLRIECPNFSDRGAAGLRPFSKLIELDVHGLALGDGTLQHFGELKDLEWVDLSGTNVTDAGLKHLKGLEELRRLTLSRTAVTGEGLTGAKTLIRLSRVELDGTKATKKGLETVVNAAGVEAVDLSNVALPDDAVLALKALPNLQRLKLNGLGTLPDKVAEGLAAFPALVEVSVVGTKLSAKGLSALKKKDGLTVISE